MKGYLLLLLFIAQIVTGIHNPNNCNYVYENNKLYPMNICIYTWNKDPHYSTAVAYECISKTELRKHIWYHNGSTNCLSGSDDDNYENYYSSSTNSTFKCDGYNNCVALIINYTDSQTLNHSCARGHQNTANIQPVVSGVCAQEELTNLFFKYSTKTSNILIRTRYNDNNCSYSLGENEIYVGDDCNITVQTKSSNIYEIIGYKYQNIRQEVIQIHQKQSNEEDLNNQKSDEETATDSPKEKKLSVLAYVFIALGVVGFCCLCYCFLSCCCNCLTP